MIVSFSVSNFRSFFMEETFSLVASNRLSDSHTDHLAPIPNTKEKVLRTGVLYGANGAGKSNLFKALQYVKSVALQSRGNARTGREVFRLKPAIDQPSSFDLQFIAEDKLYRFGFKLDDQRILEEWLVEVTGGRERVLYERITDNKGQVSVEARGLTSPGEKLVALATVGGPQNQSFLATIHATLSPSDVGEELNGVLNWFKKSLVLIGPDQFFGQLGNALLERTGLLDLTNEFLKFSSTGVDHLIVSKTQISPDDVRNLLPERLFSEVMGNIDKDENGSTCVQLSQGNELLIQRTGEDQYFQIQIQAAHQNHEGGVEAFKLNQESDGTRRLLNLIPALHHLRNSSAVYFIDEIDRSLHPMLVRTFLESFLKSCGGGHRQIIVTTHESNLLDQDLLRRDEIWFAEKDQGGSTKLYSLVDFKVRKDLEIRKHYLEGRFGAIPFFGDIDGLLSERGKTE